MWTSTRLGSSDTLQLALIGRCSPLLPRSLEEIGDLEGYIGRTETVLIFSSKGCECAAGSRAAVIFWERARH